MQSHLILARSYIADAARTHEAAYESRRSFASVIRALLAKIVENLGLHRTAR